MRSLALALAVTGCASRAAAPASPREVAASELDEPRSCDQRRLDMYTSAVTQPQLASRAKLLVGLPSCEGPERREQAWQATRAASLAATRGRCDEIEPLVRTVYSLDVALHDVVLLSDVEIVYCLDKRPRSPLP